MMAMMVLLGSLATAVVTTNRRRRTNILVFLYYALVASSSSCTTASGGDRAEGRYSFSLTTFDPQGKLGQVERAMEAAALGTPVLCVVVDDEQSSDVVDKRTCCPGSSSTRKSTCSSIVLAAPQVLPSPLMEDDGTSRFVRVTDEIVVSHSGLSADGRVLAAAAQRLAVEHEYTFDESIPIDFFLQQLSLLFQQYTMKAGARPFGCFLIVAYMPAAPLDDNKNTRRRFDDDNVGLGEEEYDNDDRQHKPLICRIDPSGCIEKFDSPIVIINGNHLESLTDLRTKLQELLTSSSSRKNVILESSSSSKLTNNNDDDDNDDDVPTRIAHLLRSSIREQAKKRRIIDDTTTTATMAPPEETILTACLSSTGQFCIERK